MDISNFVVYLSKEQKQIITCLHEIIESFQGIISKIRYKVPFYYKKSWFCYVNSIKNSDSVELCFVRANEMSNELNLLDFKDRKQVAGVTIASFTTLIELEKEIRYLIQEAIILDDTVPYSVKMS